MKYNRETIKGLAKSRGCTVKELFALAPQNDPFYVGGPAQWSEAKWFQDLFNRFEFPNGVHLRRIHYRLISEDPPVLMSNGLPYLNTDECWKTLGNVSKAARYLDLVDVDMFSDRRNPAPSIRYSSWVEPLAATIEDQTPYLGSMSLPEPPNYELNEPIPAQRYHLEIWCEKSTMNDEIQPICNQFNVNFVTGVGEMSITAVNSLIGRALENKSPVRIFYVSDFDPAGKSMPVAVARKAEFFIRNSSSDIDLKLFPIVLTEDQCREYRLPRTPIKESEKRAAGFEERFGAGATELDALEALHPGELGRILTKAIAQYFDPDLRRNFRDALKFVQSDLSDIRNEVVQDHAADIERLQADFKIANEKMREWRERADEVWLAITNDLEDAAPDLTQYELPEPAFAEEMEIPPFDSQRDYLDQLIFYKRFQGKPPPGGEG